VVGEVVLILYTQNNCNNVHLMGALVRWVEVLKLTQALRLQISAANESGSRLGLRTRSSLGKTRKPRGWPVVGLFIFKSNYVVFSLRVACVFHDFFSFSCCLL
jgi:hypothetical protein